MFRRAERDWVIAHSASTLPAGGLVGVARRLHRLTLGDRPFIPLGRNEHAFDRARNGTLYIDAREPLDSAGDRA